ncbi:MAG: PD-(D/E)XK nuclease family protein [Sandaracinus sp.]
MSARVVVHASGHARREAALAFAAEGTGPLFVVGARIDAARALAADLALAAGAVADLECTTFDGLVARIARRSLAEAGLSIATPLAVDTAAAQAVAALAEELPRMGPLRATPGLPRALGRTLDELWSADLPASSLAAHDPELAKVAARAERSLAAEKLVSRAVAIEHAIRALAAGARKDARILFLDVPLATRLAGELAHALAEHTASFCATVPRADARTLGRLEGLAVVEPVTSEGVRETAALAEQLFGAERVPVAAGTLETIVAASDAAEAAEAARRALALAREGTPLHRIAVVLRKPELGRVAIESAFQAAEIPLARRRGARRPDPSGRALLALLACAIEGLSARAFSSYLSFGAMPRTATGEPPPPSANAARRALDDDEDDDESDEPSAEEAAEAIRVPRRWERLLVEASVIGGAPDRWRVRLGGLARELARRIEELERTGGESAGVRRTLDDLAALERFAMPLLDDLAALPTRATLEVHRAHIAALATRALARPTRALAVLDELAPRAPAGEQLELSDVVRVLAPRLGALELRPEGKGVHLVTPDELRGASFEHVLVPGLVERSFPARVPEDPLLSDVTRRALSPDLEDGASRAREERLALALAVGAAERSVVALASITGAEGRARVPSVYFVELLGRRLGRVARGADVAAAMADPVRIVASPERAARSAERTIALARALADAPEKEAEGRLHFVVEQNAMLRSALGRVFRRRKERLGPADGLVLGKDHPRAALAKHAPGARPYSATALESFASCPLRFHLRAVMRLEPREEPAPLEMLDPLLRGSIAHDVQFRVLVALREAKLLPLTEGRLPEARAILDEVVAARRGALVDELVPAIPHVFHGELDALAADLREWLERAATPSPWEPRYFELAFGLPREEGRDAASRDAPVPLDEGITLRGAIDLVEVHAETGALRATDHKTGSSYAIRGRGPLVVRGGQTLQPVLYALALEKLFPGAKVEGGRLYYCTSRGGYEERTVTLDDEARAAARALAAAVTEATTKGALPAVPLPGACTYCDFRLACGADPEARAAKIPRAETEALLPGLVQLRRRA